MITNAALLLVIVSGAFVCTSLIVTKEPGLGISVAVLVDATIVRSLLGSCNSRFQSLVDRPTSRSLWHVLRES